MTARLLFIGLAITAVAVGCRENDPPPRYYEDLGTQRQPLPPPAPAWKDARLVSGTADLNPFREPAIKEGKDAGDGGAVEGAVGEAAANPEVEGEVKTAVAEYGDKLNSDAVAEIKDFYATQQAETVAKLVPALQSLSAKLTELAAAMPDEKEKLERLAGLLAPAALLKIEPASVHAQGAKAATVKLAALPEMGFLPGLEPAQIKAEVSVTLGDDEYWYFQSPVVDALAKVLPGLESAVSELDGMIADANAGAAAAMIAERSALVGQMIEKLGPAAEAAAPAEAPDPAEDEPTKEQ